MPEQKNIRKIFFMIILLTLFHTTYSAYTLSSCQTLNSSVLGSNTTVNITQNITNTGSSNCIDVEIDNISITCNGFTLIGNLSTSSIGISSNYLDSNNISISNCNFLNYSTSISFYGDTPFYNFLNIQNITMINGGTGILARAAGFYYNNTVMRNITIINMTNIGADIHAHENSLFEDFTIRNSSNTGLSVQGITRDITFNRIESTNSNTGVYIGIGTEEYVFTNSTVIDNTLYNLELRSGGSDNSFIYGNNLGNISKIFSNNWLSITNLSFNLSEVGNTYNSYLPYTPYCFDEPNNNTCDFSATSTSLIPNSVEQKSLFSMGSIYISLIFLILFFY